MAWPRSPSYFNSRNALDSEDKSSDIEGKLTTNDHAPDEDYKYWIVRFRFFLFAIWISIRQLPIWDIPGTALISNTPMYYLTFELSGTIILQWCKVKLHLDMFNANACMYDALGPQLLQIALFPLVDVPTKLQHESALCSR